jgi:hypothetical protein
MNIHIILQGKGGVGKSLVASLLAQYKIKKGETPLCIDTDPVNTTFKGYKALNVKHLDIMEEDEINPRKFDDLIELIASSKNDVIIDNGASSFVPLSHYLLSNEVPALLSDLGHNLIIHTVVTGGQGLLDTLNGFSRLINSFKGSPFYVWLNPFAGSISSKDGASFEEMKVYKDNAEKITAIITLPELKKETYGKDFENMLSLRITFDEAIEREGIFIMEKQRLKIIQRDIFDQLRNIPDL